MFVVVCGLLGGVVVDCVDCKCLLIGFEVLMVLCLVGLLMNVLSVVFSVFVIYVLVVVL